MKKNKTGFMTSRVVYKAVKKYDHQQFDEFCQRVYNEGVSEGMKQQAKETEQSVSIVAVLEVIKDVKGVGPALAGKIKDKINSEFNLVGRE